MAGETAASKCQGCGEAIAPDALFCPMCGVSRESREDDPLVGEVIAERYLLRERIGHGGSGTIYLAEHVTLRRKVVVKILHHELSRDEMAMERFRREATTVGEIDNEHIVQVMDFGRAPDNRLFLAMEYLQGATLAELLKEKGRLSIDQVVDVLTQLGEALMEAHAMGYIHRDLRPGNVFLTDRRGRKGFVRLLDFGLAKLVEHEGEAASTSLGMTFGDPRYMSPEQAQGQPVDRRGDIYSLGIMAYEMLTGKPPFAGERVFEVLTQHLDTVPDSPANFRSDVPPWLDAVVMRALAKEPPDRFSTVYRLVEALSQGRQTGEIMSEEAAKSMPDITPPPPAPRQANDKGPGETHAGVVPAKASANAFATHAGVVPAKARASQTKTAVIAASGPPPDAGLSGSFFADGERLEADDESIPRFSDTLSFESDNSRRIRWIIGGAFGLVTVVVVTMMVYSGEAPSSEVAATTTVPEKSADQSNDKAVPVEAKADVAPATAGALSADGISGGDPAAIGAVDIKSGQLVAGTGADESDGDHKNKDDHKNKGDHKIKGDHKNKDDHKIRDDQIRDDQIRDDAEEVQTPADQKAQADFFVKLGTQALHRGDAVGAAGNFNKAREFDPRNAAAIAGLGEIAMRQGHFGDAVVHLTAASRLAPRSKLIHTLRGQALLGDGRKKAAVVAFKRALELDPDHQPAKDGYAKSAGD